MNQQINLYRPELRPRRIPLPAARMAQLLVVALLAMAAYYGYTRAGLRPLAAERTAANQRLIAAEQEVDRLRQQYPPPVADESLARDLKTRQASLAQTREVALKLREGAFGTSDGLSPYLESFARQHVDGTWLTHVRVQGGGSALALDGRTLAPELVPVYLQRLAAERVLQGKSFSELSMKTLAEELDEIVFSVRTVGIELEDDS